MAEGGAPYRHVEHAGDLDPSAAHRVLLDRCPVHHEADHVPPFFVLSRFDDVSGALKRPELWNNKDGPGVFFQQSGVLGSADDPDHARHRRVIRDAFLPSAINALEPRVARMCEALFDRIVPKGSGDFVADVAAPLPAHVIAELLGVPADRHEQFAQWSTEAVTALTGGDVQAYERAKASLEDVIEEAIDERDRRLAGASASSDDGPPDDVALRLARARRDGTLRPDEARYLGYQLLVAGHETTTSLLGMLLWRLIERPELMAALRADRSLVPAAVEESVRYDAPVQGLFRTNAQEVCLHDRQIPERSKVQLLFAAANRDPRFFAEPDEFRVDRAATEIGRHLGFGWGIHLCVGAPLARLEARLVFEQVLTRMHDIELTGPPRRNHSFVLRGLTGLPIRWRS